MAWSIFGDSYDTDSDLSNGTKSIRIKWNDNIILQYVRTWVVFFNDPGITNLTMKIYADENESKGDLLYSSLTTHTKAEMLTLDNGIKEVYFEFDKPSMDANNYYHLVLTGSSSGFSSSSHIAWKTSYPYPVYSEGVGVSFSNLPKFPYTCSTVGAAY